MCSNTRKSYFHIQKVVNAYLLYELDNWPVNSSNNSTIKKIFGTAKLTRNTIKRKFIYNGFGLVFDVARSWSFGTECPQNVLVLTLVHQDSLKIMKVIF